MKTINQLTLILIIALVSVISANGYTASQTSTATLNFTEHISIVNNSYGDLVIQASIGELAITNITSADQEILTGYFYTTIRILNGSSNLTTNICIDTWSCTGYVRNASFEYRQCTRIDTSCTTTGNKPEEKRNVTGWETSIVLMYLGAIALYLFYGMSMKDHHLEQMIIKSKLVKEKATMHLVFGLKLLYTLVMPGLVILGIHIAREIALAQGAPVSVTDSLLTALRIFMWIYVFTLFVAIIITIRNVLGSLADTTTASIAQFRSMRKTKRGSKP